MKALLPLAALLLLTGCPESIGQQCPPRTAAVGQFELALTGIHDAGTECLQKLADGGGQKFTLDDGGSNAGALCYANDGQSQQLYFVAPGKGARPSSLLPDGGFHFVGHTEPTTGICNGCAVTIDETFDGFMQSGAAGAPFVLQADGGLPPVKSLSGTVVDLLSSDAGGCQCNVPCTISYSVNGAPF